MRVLVLNPPNQPFTDPSLLIEPIDILTLATLIREWGHEVRVIDMDREQLAAPDLEAVYASYAPCYTVVPFDYHIPLYTGEAAEGVRAIVRQGLAAGSRVVLGGRPVTFYPEQFLVDERVVLVAGEMEPALAALLQLSLWEATAWRDVPGVIYRTGGSLTRTPRARPVDLDRLPIPDRSLVDVSRYIGVRSLLSSRGCVERCTFCPVPPFWGSWRKRSPAAVADEIELLTAHYGATKILFLDDHATVDSRRMRLLSRELIRRRVQVALGCLGTIASFDRDTFAEMYAAGFRWVHFGAEFADDRVLGLLRKRHTVAESTEAVAQATELGFRVRTSWILDAPGADAAALGCTVDLMLSTPSHELRAHFLAPRAGAPLVEEHREAGDDGALPPQYLHAGAPVLGHAALSREVLDAEVQRLTEGLAARGYHVVRRPDEWRHFATANDDPAVRFVSFCPGRYGIGWRW